MAYTESISPDILEVGAGKGKAAEEMSRLYPDRHVNATVLTWNDVLAEGLGANSRVHIYKSPVETLEGIKPASQGGILAVISTAYSLVPHRAAMSMDRVLLPGGAIKMACVSQTHGRPTYREEYYFGTLHTKSYIGALALAATGGSGMLKRFIADDWETRRNRVKRMVSAEEYAAWFKRLGYDTYVGASPYDKKHSIFLGIKPVEHSLNVSAKELYEQDYQTWEAQYNRLSVQTYK